MTSLFSYFNTRNIEFWVGNFLSFAGSFRIKTMKKQLMGSMYAGLVPTQVVPLVHMIYDNGQKDVMSDFYLHRSAWAYLRVNFKSPPTPRISFPIDSLLNSACYMRLISIFMLSKKTTDIPINVYTFYFLTWP